MYKEERQMRLEDFVFPYGKLNPENEWVKLVDLIPWDLVEERYAEQFENNGHPAHPARMALGALLIKQRLRCSDEWTVRHVSENPYLQYFIGMRVDCGLTLEQLESKTGLSKSALSSYENDDKNISLTSIVKLAKFYGVSTDFLLGLAESKNHPNADLSVLHLSDAMIELLRSGKRRNHGQRPV